MTTSALAGAKSLSVQFRPSTPGRLKSGAAAPSAKVGGFSAARMWPETNTTASKAINERFMSKCYAGQPQQQGGLCEREVAADVSPRHLKGRTNAHRTR